MHRGGWLAALLLVLLLAGCTAPPGFLSTDPVAASTFTDSGSNETVWALEITGRFHLPSGTRFMLEADNATCTTTGIGDTHGNRTYGCRSEDDRVDRYQVTVSDLDGDQRASHGDRLTIRPGPGHTNGTFYGPHVLRLALHPEVPLFLLEQEFGPEGPSGPLAVELLG